MLTRDGIAYNLELSPYKEVITYSKNDSLTFIFSSELYRGKFKEKLEANREKINTSLSNRFKFNIVNDKLSDIQLYSSVEKRGFLIKEGESKYKCLSTIKLNGQNKIQKK